MKSGIYEILNTVNQNRYIGSSINIKARWNSHKSSLRIGKHRNKHLQRAYNKYGKGAFVYSVLEYCEPQSEVLIKCEQKWLDVYTWDTLYNMLPEAGHTKGFKWGIEARKAISGKRHHNYRKPMPDSVKKKISAAQTGKIISLESRKKMSKARKGKPCLWLKGKKRPKETCLKMSRSKKGDKHNNYGKHLEKRTRKKISDSLRDKSPKNKSGYVGVCYGKTANKWIASIRIMGKQKHIGYFGTKEEAVLARNKYIIDNNLPNKIHNLLPDNL